MIEPAGSIGSFAFGALNLGTVRVELALEHAQHSGTKTYFKHQKSQCKCRSFCLEYQGLKGGLDERRRVGACRLLSLTEHENYEISAAENRGL